jgi:hypothetical protein
MYFEYVPKSEVMGPKGRQYFLRSFWIFRQCVKVFKHCYDVLSIDGTFLTGKHENTMLVAIDIDADRQLIPLTFAILEKQNNDSWGWAAPPHATQARVYIEYNNEMDTLMLSSVSTCYSFL